MPLPIQRPDQAAALTRHYGTRGRMRLQLDETVVPVVLVDDIVLRSDRVVARSVVVPQAVGMQSSIVLINPPGSGLELTLEGWRIQVTDAASSVALTRGPNLPPPADVVEFPGIICDTTEQSLASAAGLRTDPSDPGGAEIYETPILQPGESDEGIGTPIIIAAGGAIAWTSAADPGLTFAAWWTERVVR